MTKQMGELKINKSADYYNKVVKALVDAGFVIILSTETTTDRYYIVAEGIKNGAQLPKGYWERISNDITLIQHDTAYYKCSECGEKVIGKHNYCQFCGAKMVEPQESEK